jgi:hypothetical protein
MGFRSTDTSRYRGSLGSAKTLANTLGWFSIGLGTVEFMAPGLLARSFGTRGSRGLIAGYGVREITAGIGILNADDPTPWVWARVGGDALDLATLAGGLMRRHSRKGTLLAAMLAVGGVMALDMICAQALAAKPSYRRLRGVRRFDYSDRSGFRRPLEQVRGIAREGAVAGPAQPPEQVVPLPGQAQPASG